MGTGRRGNGDGRWTGSGADRLLVGDRSGRGGATVVGTGVGERRVAPVEHASLGAGRSGFARTVPGGLRSRRDLPRIGADLAPRGRRSARYRLFTLPSRLRRRGAGEPPAGSGDGRTGSRTLPKPGRPPRNRADAQFSRAGVPPAGSADNGGGAGRGRQPPGPPT